MGQGKRGDLLALRDAILEGQTDLELALNDETARPSAQFMKWTQNLRNKNRAQSAAVLRKLQMTGMELSEWQNQAVLNLDECDNPFSVPLFLFNTEQPFLF